MIDEAVPLGGYAVLKFCRGWMPSGEGEIGTTSSIQSDAK